MSNSMKTGLWLFGVILFAIFSFAFYRILLPEIESMAIESGTEAKEHDTNTEEEKEQAASTEEKTADTSQIETQNDDLRYAVPEKFSPYDILKTGQKDKKIKQIAAMYGEMEPEGAAKTLEAMEETIAIEILLRMRPKQAGSILDNMKTEKAVKFMESLLRETKTDTVKGKPESRKTGRKEPVAPPPESQKTMSKTRD